METNETTSIRKINYSISRIINYAIKHGYFVTCRYEAEYTKLLLGHNRYWIIENMDDLIKLFEDWYQTLYRIPHNLELDGSEENCLKVR